MLIQVAHCLKKIHYYYVYNLIYKYALRRSGHELYLFRAIFTFFKINMCNDIIISYIFSKCSFFFSIILNTG